MDMEPQIRYKEKSVIIHRDEHGFGLRVGGQNPVFVDCVHENGAAWKAGVRKDDRIIKVNGTLVKSYDHQQVVHMIQNCTPFVNLTLHSPETVVTEPYTVVSSELQSTEPNNSSLLLGNSNANNNIVLSSIKPKIRPNRNQPSTEDNPYYYYKTAPEKVSEATSYHSATSSQRSTSVKYKPRNLRSRLVEDLRSLTITNNQATPSSLSTSPSSSDLSDCDDPDSNRIDCLSTSASNTSASGAFLNTSSNANSSDSIPVTSQSELPKPRHTTRRLEIIKELVDTEKTHTERLKQLNDLLYKPIKAEGLVPIEQLKMVFSCHKTLLKIHRKIYKILLASQQNISECHQEPLVGKALVEIFEGELGERLETAASKFCACQSTNTELLNRFTRKDTKAGEFLAQVANQQMLGRLGIKDLLASCFQRLTKYPLLLDNLLKATPSNTDDEAYAYERLCISRALHQSREILIRVNETVKRAISHYKLREIWKKTDKYASLPVINIETQQMLHEGPLTLRLARKTFEVYVLLLTHYIIILTREGQDKYKLKNFTADGKEQFSPIFNIDKDLATRDTATDENGFYLLCKSKKESRIYEFASQSPAERAKWKEKIHMAKLYNFAAVPDDDNTINRYTELISLSTSSDTPNNIEQSPTNINTIANSATQSNTSLNEVNYTPATSSAQKINSNIGHDSNVRAQDV